MAPPRVLFASETVRASRQQPASPFMCLPGQTLRQIFISANNGRMWLPRLNNANTASGSDWDGLFRVRFKVSLDYAESNLNWRKTSRPRLPSLRTSVRE